MPYTQAQWLHLPEGKRGFKTYGRYMDWWNQTVKPKLIKDRKPPVAGRPGVSNPTIPSYLNPISQEDLLAQANAQVTASTAPVLKQIADQFAEQTTRIGGQYATMQKQGIEDIGAAQNIWQSALQQIAPKTQDAYNASIQGQQAVNTGIQDFLQGQGKLLMGDVSQQAQSAGAPAETLAAIAGRGSQEGVQGVGGLAAGAQAAAVGQGAGALGQLYGAQAADAAYNATLPGVASQVGAQDTGRFVRDVGTRQAASLAEIAAGQQAATGEVTAGIPGLVQDVYSNLLQNETTKAGLLGNFKADAASRALQKWQTRQQTALQKWVNRYQAKQAALGNSATAKHYQIGFAPDGTPYVFDPATSGTEFGPKGKYAKPGSGPGGAANKKLQGVQEAALGIAQDFFKRKNAKPARTVKRTNPDTLLEETKTFPAQPGQRTPNVDAIPPIVTYYKQQFPGKSDAWVQQQAALTLMTAGYNKAAVVLQSPQAYSEWKKAAGAGGTALDSWWNKWWPSASPKAQKAAGGSLANAKTSDRALASTPSAKPPKTSAPATSPSEKGSAKQSQTAADIQAKKDKAIADKAKAAADLAKTNSVRQSEATKNIESRLANLTTAAARVQIGRSQVRATWAAYLVSRYKITPKDARGIIDTVFTNWQRTHQNP